MYNYKNGFIKSNKVIRIWYHYVSFQKKKKAREGKKWKEKFRSIYLNHSILLQKTKCFNSTYVLGKTPSCSIKQLSMHSTTKKIFSPKKKKKFNRWWEENNSLCNMTCNTKITCIRLSNFCIKIVLYSFKNLPWKYEKSGVPYLTSLHYSW